MSVEWMGQVWKHAELEGSSLLLLLAIADHANAEGYCWPSVPTLAKQARLSERQAQRVLVQLEKGGFIRRENKGGRGNHAYYYLQDVTGWGRKGDTITSPFPPSKGDIEGAERVTSGAERVTSSAQKGDIQGHATYTRDDPSIEPSVIHQDEPSSADAGSLVRENAEDFKVVVATMEKVGIGLTPFLTDTYHEEMVEHGVRAVVAGMLAAAGNSKQHSMAYVKTCIRNAAQGREPPKGERDKQEEFIHGDDYEGRRKRYVLEPY